MTSWELKAPPIATLLQDRFEFVEFLGKGGFASVYKVKRLSLARTEALKVFLGKRSEDPEFGRRFQQEARVAASLEHPNIVHIYDFGEAQGTFWYSMQYVDGPTLTSEMKSKGPLGEEIAARLSISLLDALDYSHGRGVVHRDIKPDNLILDRRGNPYLMDFGIAKSADSMVETQSGFILGSPAFLSPEQLRGEPLDGRTDVYSFGITLYEMLSGARPFDATDRTELMIQRLKEDPIRIETKRPEISAQMAAIVMKALERERGRRFTGAAEMRDALSGLVADRASPTRSMSSRSGERQRPSSSTVRAQASEREEPESTQPTSRLEIPTGATVKRRAGPPPLHAGARVASADVPDAASGNAAEVSAEVFAEDIAPPPVKQSALRWVPVVLMLATFAGAFAIWRNTPRERPVAPSQTPVPAVPPSQASVPPVSPTAIAITTPAPKDPPPAPTAPMVGSIPAAAPEPTLVAVEPAPNPVPRRPERTARPEVRSAQSVESERTPPSRAVPPPDARQRRVKSLPEEEYAEPLKLSPELAQEYAGKKVGLSVTIGEDGAVKSAKVISPVAPRCDECDRAALDAVKRYRFLPARDADGLPIETKVAISVGF
ncbi:MAG: TonB family protein [Thermoanaerobaculia bacterium]